MRAGIPTIYKGIRFRSRLEAKWACMFDLLGWRWEYEPFDLAGWIPDFALIGQEKTALVEVKPIQHFAADIAEEMMTTAAGGKYELMLVGSGLIKDQQNFPDMAFYYLGWSLSFVSRHRQWLQRQTWEHPSGRFDIILSCEDPYPGHFYGEEVGHCKNDWGPFGGAQCRKEPGSVIGALWAKASNTVQWKAPR